MYYHTVQLVKGFVINLDNREDRWRDSSSQFSKLPFEVERVSAVFARQIEKEEPYVPGGVAATWRSHQKAMKAHLQSGTDFGFILEDDFLISRDISHILAKVLTIGDFDLVQFGYLSPSLLRRFIRHLIGFRDIFLKLLNRLSKRVKLSIFEKLLIREQSEIPFSLVLNDIQAGGQAYMVSRRFSEAAQHMNNPSFLSADGMLMSLSETRTFKVARVRFNQIKQSDSITSVQIRFKLN
jgi:GR25 family glycosyltransferase involved in LPS biosynthesis